MAARNSGRYHNMGIALERHKGCYKIVKPADSRKVALADKAAELLAHIAVAAHKAGYNN